MDYLASILELDSSQDRFEWGKDTATKFSSTQLTNGRLLAVLSKVGYKASMGIAVALTELIQLRSKNQYPYINITEEFAPKIEALWAAAIDPLYLRDPFFDYKYADENGVKATYSSNWYILRYIARRYIAGSYYIHEFLVNIAMLTRHLMPNKGLFDKWFTETMQKTVETFPCLYDYGDLDENDEKAVYDCSADVPVPREFFFNPEFIYSPNAAKSVLNSFLKSLNYRNNLWLCTPEEMLEKGFKGTPYKVE